MTIGQGGINAAAPRRGGDQPVARHVIAHLWPQFDGMAVAQLDAGRLAQGDPIGGGAGGIAALALAFDGDLHLAVAVVAGDMGFVAIAVGHQRLHVRHIDAVTQTGHVEGKEDVSEIGKDQHRGGKARHAFAPEATAGDLLSGEGGSGKVGHRMAPLSL